jgi:hypothetical protein
VGFEWIFEDFSGWVFQKRGVGCGATIVPWPILFIVRPLIGISIAKHSLAYFSRTYHSPTAALSAFFTDPVISSMSG